MAGKHFDLDTNTLLGGNSPSDITIASQKATKIYVDNQIKTVSNGGFSIESPELVPIEGICTWTITHNLNSTNIICSLYLNNSEIEKDIDILSANSIQIQFYAADTLSAGACKALILIKNGANNSSGDTSNLANISLNNLNSNGKSTITKYSAPEYCDAIYVSEEDFPTGTFFTAPFDGWIYVGIIHTSTSSEKYIQVTPYDGELRLASYRCGGCNGNVNTVMVPIKKKSKNSY